MTLIISKSTLERLINHCKPELPREACGLYVRSIYPLTNVADLPWLYRAKPEDLYTAMKEIEEAGFNRFRHLPQPSYG